MSETDRQDLDVVLDVHVRLRIYGNGYLEITSKDVPGLTLGGENYDAVSRDIVPAVRQLLAINRVYPISELTLQTPDTAQLLKDKEELRDLLGKLFADFGDIDLFKANGDAESIGWRSDGTRNPIIFGDLRKARALLTRLQTPDKGSKT